MAAAPHRPRRASRLALPLFALAALLAAGGCSGDSGGGARHLVVVSIDTLRADALAGAGPRRAATPGLDELAAGGRRFTNAWSHVPLTLPSHATLLTGRLPPELGLHDNTPFPLRGDVPTLATWLGERGFATAAVIGGQPLARGSGIERGFEQFDDPPRAAGGAAHFGERDARDVTDRALAAWREPAGGRRRFLFVHYFDPHQPYVPPRDCMQGDPADVATRYRGEVTFVDRELARLVAALRAGGERCLLVVTSDHGEGLGDHGEQTHGFQLLPSTLHVPLLIAELEGATTRLPAELADCPADRLFGLADLVPTLLPLLRVATPDGLAGRPLQERDAPIPARYVECLSAALQLGLAQQSGVRGEGALLVHGGVDPPATIDGLTIVAPAAPRDGAPSDDERCLLDPGRAPPTADELAAWRDAFDEARVRRLPPPATVAATAALTRLGYLPAASDRDAPQLRALEENALLPSPLARRGAIDALLAAVARLEAGEALAAATALTQLLEAESELWAARFFRARARLELAEGAGDRAAGAASEAAADLATLLAVAPRYPGAALLRAKALGMAGAFADAVAAIEELARAGGAAADAADVEWLHGSLLLEAKRAGRVNPLYDPQSGFDHLLRAIELAPRPDRVRSVEQQLAKLARTSDAPPWVAALLERARARRGRRRRPPRPPPLPAPRSPLALPVPGSLPSLHRRSRCFVGRCCGVPANPVQEHGLGTRLPH